MQDETRDIPLADTVEPWVVLRLVNRESVEYLELRDSMADRGLLTAICVRLSPRQTGKFEVIAGLHRRAAALELGWQTIPAIIKHGLTDDDVLALQVQENAIRLETTPVEYARRIKVVAEAKPGITLAGLSQIIHKSPYWISQTLDLLALRTYIQKAVDRGEIPLGSAYMLSHVPRDHQSQFFDLARTASVAEFRRVIAAYLKRLKEAARQGKMDAFYQEEIEPHAYLRPLKELEAEYKDRQIGALRLAAANCTNPLDAWYLCLQWAIHLDPESVEQQRQQLLERLKTNTLKEIDP